MHGLLLNLGGQPKQVALFGMSFFVCLRIIKNILAVPVGRKEKNMKLTLSDIKKMIPSRIPFGHYYHDEFGPYPIAFSAGIEVATMDDVELYGEVAAAIKRFQSGDFGTAYDVDVKPIKFFEYGKYDTSIGDIYIHRDGVYDILYGAQYDFVVYFYFER